MGEYKNYPLIIAPNLGAPEFVTLKVNRSYSVGEGTGRFNIDIWVMAPGYMDERIVFGFLDEHIFLRPIIDYDERRGIGIRGSDLPAVSVVSTKVKPMDISDPSVVLMYDYGFPDGRLITDDVFPGRTVFYRVTAEFGINAELKAVLERYGHIMFDLIQKFPEEKSLEKVNPHAVVLTEDGFDFTDFTVIHATDLHIARRNDEVLAVILKKIGKSLIKRFVEMFDTFKKKEYGPIEERALNPNNNLRMLIYLLNEWRERDARDRMNGIIGDPRVTFAVFTGDLVDFVTLSSIGDKNRDFSLNRTNWSVFLSVLLNRPITYRADIEPVNVLPSAEIMVPVITVPGNHDYRLFHYDLRWGHLHKVVNLRYHEILLYSDKAPSNPVTCLYSGIRALGPYNRFINPFMNFYMKFGNHTFIFLDSGYDSAKATSDLLSANPSSTGFSDNQLAFTRNIVNYRRKERFVRRSITINSDRKEKNGRDPEVHGGFGNVATAVYSGSELPIPSEGGLFISFHHAPILNPKPISAMPIKIRSKFYRLGFRNISDFSESRLAKISEGAERRADPYLEFKHGTISNNWDGFLGLTADFGVNVFAGHTHRSFECRIEPTFDRTPYTYNEFLVIRRGTELPAAIYIDNYSVIYNSPDFFSSHIPFHIQTPALGVGVYGENKDLFGPFRIIKIRRNKLHSFRLDFISNHLEDIAELLVQRKVL